VAGPSSSLSPELGKSALHARPGCRPRREALGRYGRSTPRTDSVGAIRDSVGGAFELRQVGPLLAEQRGNPRSLKRERRSLRIVFIICVARSRSGNDVVELGRQRFNVSHRRSLLRIEKILGVPFSHLLQHYQASSCSPS
jgi:hypothetical protein